MTARIVALAMAVLSLAAGCATLPQQGPVTTESSPAPSPQGAGSFDYTPSGPRPGSPPATIVEDFLLAMQASPQTTAVARKYLTDEGRASWAPERRTLVYGAKVVTGGTRGFTVNLQDAVHLDDRGTWQGSGDGAVEYRLRLARERGEWRITNPPDALVIPRSHFESRYQQYFLYFFDPTARVLIPEPTYLERGDQAATVLVRRLQRGPAPELAGVLRTFIPPGMRYALSVPVSPGGVADVELTEHLLQLDQDDRQMALAQLAWTLRQVTGIESMRVTVNGSPIDIPGAGSPQSVSSWTEFDPSIHWASQELFGVRDGEVVALPAGGSDVAGQFATHGLPLRDIAVDLAGEQVAAVTEDGTTAVLAARGSDSGASSEPDQRAVVASGTDLLRPGWDVFGHLWLVDRTPRGAAVSVLANGTAARITAPGLDGLDVSGFAVSRDGSRLVAVVKDLAGDRLVISRVVRGAAGRVRGLTPAVELPLAQGGVDEIRDIAWRSPGSVAVLTGPTVDSSQVLLALVDGSTALADVDSTAEIFGRRAVHLAASPSGVPLVVGSPKGQLFELGGDGQWSELAVSGPLLAPTFVG